MFLVLESESRVLDFLTMESESHTNIMTYGAIKFVLITLH